MAQRHADLFEVGFDQVSENARVDLMLAEQGFVLSEVDRVQPLGDVHRRSRTRFDSMLVPGRPRVQVRSVGRSLWGRFDPFAMPPGNVCSLRKADGSDRQPGKRRARMQRNENGPKPLVSNETAKRLIRRPQSFQRLKGP